MQTKTIFDYYSLTSDRLLLPEDAVERIVAEALPSGSVTRVTTYLANAIERLDADGESRHRFPTARFRLSIPPRHCRCIISFARPRHRRRIGFRWSSTPGRPTNCRPEVGTPLRVAYYEPEVENGREIERFFDAVVTDIVPITKPANRIGGGGQRPLISRQRCTTIPI